MESEEGFKDREEVGLSVIDGTGYEEDQDPLKGLILEEEIMSIHPKLSGKKILIVDDEIDVLDTLEEYLEGCIVKRASNFEDAKDLLEKESFDVAVLDIMGVDGYRLLSLAKKRDIPAVMLTAHAFSPENLVKSIKGGALSYIPKEKLHEIQDFLVDVLEAREKGEDAWKRWQVRLPESYFEKRWGKAWDKVDPEFWQKFKASLKSRKE